MYHCGLEVHSAVGNFHNHCDDDHNDIRCENCQLLNKLEVHTDTLVGYYLHSLSSGGIVNCVWGEHDV